MSTPASRKIDDYLSGALEGAYRHIQRYLDEGYCAPDDVTEALSMGWGEAVLEGWREYLGEEAFDRDWSEAEPVEIEVTPPSAPDVVINGLLRQVEDLKKAVERHGPCICNTGPGTEGPDEFCPQHGRTYDDMIEYLDRIITHDRAETRRKQAQAWSDGYSDCLDHIARSERETFNAFELLTEQPPNPYEQEAEDDHQPPF